MAFARHTGAQSPQPVQTSAETTSASPPSSAIAPQRRRRQAPQRLQREAAMAKVGPGSRSGRAGHGPARDGAGARHRGRMRGLGGLGANGSTPASYRTGRRG